MESWVSRSVLKTNLGKKDGTLQGGMWEPHSASNCRGTQITSLRGCGWYHGGWGGFGHAAGRKEQGRRRSITLTALPAPDIEIGLRRPVDPTMPRYFADICDLFHIRRKKLRPAPGARAGAGPVSFSVFCNIGDSCRMRGRGNLDRLR